MRAALEGFTTSWCRPGLQRWDDGLAARRQVLDLYASLLRAQPARSTRPSVTQAFAQFVGALGRAADRQARADRRRLLPQPALHADRPGAAAGLHAGHGAGGRGRRLRHRRRLYRALADDVALAIITLVTSTASKRAGLQRLAAHGRAQGSLIAVDITQAAGIVDVDVSAPPSTSPPPPRSSGSAARPAQAWPTSTRRCWTSACNRWCRAGSASPILQLGSGQILAGHAGAPLRQRHAVASCYVASAPGLSWLLSPAAGMRAHNQALSRKRSRWPTPGLPAALAARASERGGSVMVELPAHIDALALEARLATEACWPTRAARCCACRRAC